MNFSQLSSALLVGLTTGLILQPRAHAEEPLLKVGVLSDIHLSDEAVRPSKGDIRNFERILGYYRQEQADAVIIAGDLTNGGRMSELRVVCAAWKRVFGDGPEPEKVFVTGNHERAFYERAKENGKLQDSICTDALYADIKKNWKELFGEDWSPFFIKKVKGYSFVGSHWNECLDEAAFRAFFDAHRAELSGPKPFFYVQHAHPKDTCHGSNLWDRVSGGAAAEVLSSFPYAVAFSGHTHYSLVDERAVWQETFTSIGTSALRCVYLPPGRENGSNKTRMTWMRGGSQGLFMRVYANRLVLERYDLASMKKIGEDWTVPIPARGANSAFSFAQRATTAPAPEFSVGAAIRLESRRGKNPKGEDEDQIVVTFPAAHGTGDSLSRVFDYEVRTEGAARSRTKLVYQPGVLGIKPSTEPDATCVFGVCELPQPPYRLTVTPRNSLGVQGRPLCLQVEKH